MSPTEQQKRNQLADQVQLRSYALKLNLLGALILHYVYTPHYAWTLLLTALVSGVLYVKSALYTPLGRIARGLSQGIKYMIALPVIIWVGLYFLEHFPYRHEAAIFASLLGVIIGLWRESLGIYHVSAEPQAPSVPLR